MSLLEGREEVPEIGARRPALVVVLRPLGEPPQGELAARTSVARVDVANTARKPPQLVLLDYDLPGMDGVELLSRLRALPGAKKARVIVISATAGDAERWRFDALGVDGIAQEADHDEGAHRRHRRARARPRLDRRRGGGRLIAPTDARAA